jgi:hypothetical protein
LNSLLRQGVELPLPLGEGGLELSLLRERAALNSLSLRERAGVRAAIRCSLHTT